MTTETTRHAAVAALTAEAAFRREEAARFAGIDPRRPVGVDPSKGQADPAGYARMNLVAAGLCESLAARLAHPGPGETAEATLARVRAVLLEGGQDDATARRRALAILLADPT